MTHQTLYRKYRPGNFTEVKGQDQVVELFKQVIENKKIGHAYLFSGGRGTGKTSVARIIAKELGTDQSDIYEIDAASNRGIDEIRLIRDGVSTFPFASKYKIYIIDEAHMLTTPACNALLKTLEEPPAHCIFILATTEAQKLPATIRSRCQIVEFKKAEIGTLIDLLIEVAKAENVKIDIEGARAIANLGDGSYRDTFTILEKCIALSAGAEINKELVDSVYSTPDREFAVQIIKKISEGDTHELMLEMATLKEKQVNAKQLLELLIDCARIALMSRFDKNHVYIQKIKSIYSDDQFQTLCDSGIKAKFPINSQALSSLISTHQAISESISDDWLYIELAVVSLLETQANK